MRGIATVISVGLVSILLFTIFAPAAVEPVAEVVLQDSAVQNSAIDEQSFVDSMLNSLLVWAPLFVLGSAVVSAFVWYTREERRAVRRRP